MILYLQLFWEFFKTGLFAVGGGMATIPFLYNMADSTGWFTRIDVDNMIAVGESTPGPIGVNMATYVGYITGMNEGGLPFALLGAVVATLGLITPSIIVILIIASFLRSFRDNRYVESAFYGLRPAVTGLIAAAAFEIYRITLLAIEPFLETRNLLNLFQWKNIVLFAALFILNKKVKWHPVFIILIAAAAGIVFQL